LLIIFDLDDTLIDTSLSITPFVLKNIFYKMKEKGLKVKERDLKILLDIDKKSISSKESLKKFLKKLNQIEFLNFAENELENFDLEMEVLPRKGALNLLKELKSFCKIALVTIGNEKIQRKKMEKSGIDNSFFCFIDIIKNNKIFSYLKIKKKYKEEIWVCGDRIDVDLKPAKLLNFKTIHMKYGRGKFYKKEKFFDYQIKELEDIKKILSL